MARKHTVPVGLAETVNPLGGAMAEGKLETSRAGKRGLWKVVYQAGKPGTGDQRSDVVKELLRLLGKRNPKPVRREALWLLSETGGDEVVEPVAACLKEKDLREDARIALDNIPGEKSLAALKEALKQVPPDFKGNVAQSLRHRGVKVKGHPCRKLVPVKKTEVGK